MTQSTTITDAMVLAAIDRAARHREKPQVPAWAVYEHLAVPRRSGQARKVRQVLDALTDSNQLERSRLHGMDAWSLTRTGQRVLRTAKGSSDPPVLPESPQHAAWHSARTLASQEIDRFRAETAATLREALQTVAPDAPGNSDVLFEFSEQLRFQLWRLGSASYCLHEWTEPTDEHPDPDRREDRRDTDDNDAQPSYLSAARRQGRRNTSLWSRELG